MTLEASAPANQLPDRVIRLTNNFTGGKLDHEAHAPLAVRESGRTNVIRCAADDVDESSKDMWFDGGDHTFNVLLQQLAKQHRSKLSELQAARAELQSLNQKRVRFSEDATRDDVSLQPEFVCPGQQEHAFHRDMSKVNVASSYDSFPRAPNKARIVKVEEDQSYLERVSSPLPPSSEPSAMPGTTLRDTARSEDTEIEVMEEARGKSMRTTAVSMMSMDVYDLRQNWLVSEPTYQKVNKFNSMSVNATKGFAIFDEKDDRIHQYNGYFRHFIAFPASPKRLAWDLAGAVLIFWDLLVIPMSVSEILPLKSKVIDVMDWITLIFWTLNMPSTLCVGYVKNGLTEMDPRKIGSNYLRTWFVPDIVVVVPDWIVTIAKSSGDGTEAADSVKLMRILRLIRMTRLLRLAKLKSIISSITDLINSEYTSIVVNIVKMIISLLAISHFIACGWFMTSESDKSNNWVKNEGFSEADWTYQYGTSLHWAITQFTPASMSVQPQNTYERAFALAVVIFGLVGFSYLVGSITGSLTELRKMNSDTVKAFWNLRRYLNQNKVPTELSVRIQKYLEHQWQSMKVSISRESVIVLKYMSEQLENELQCAMTVPHMLVHSLFKYLNGVSSVTMQRLATQAISEKHLAAGDSLFFPLETATHMCFIVFGRLQYMRSNEVREWVEKDQDWISEPVLWTSRWHHRGELVAPCPCDLLCIKADRFTEIIKRSPQVYVFVCRYASNYIAWINSMDHGQLSDITKGEQCGDKIRQMMIGMVPSSRTTSVATFAREKSIRVRLSSWKRGFLGRAG